MKTVIAGLIVMASAASSVHAAEAADSKAGRACLFASQPSSWQVLDRQHLVLWGPTQRDAYLVTLFAPVTDLAFAETLAFIDGDHNGMICGGVGDEIKVPSTTIPSFPTAITSMRKVDDAELVKLGEQYKVKLLSDKKIKEVKAHDKQIPEKPTAASAQ